MYVKYLKNLFIYGFQEGREPPEDLNEDFEEIQKEPLSPSIEKEDNTRPPSEDCPLLEQPSIRSRFFKLSFKI